MKRIDITTYEEFKKIMEEAYRADSIIKIYTEYLMDFEKAKIIDMRTIDNVESLDLEIFNNKHPYKKHIVIIHIEDLNEIKNLEEKTRSNDTCIYCIDDINESGYQANVYQCQLCGTKKYIDRSSYHYYDLPKKMVTKE